MFSKLISLYLHSGANMIAHNMNDVRDALRQVGQQFLQQPSSSLKSHGTVPEVSNVTSAGLATTSPKTYTCPACGLGNLTENALHLHFPLYHSPQPNYRSACPICGQPPTRAPFAVHLHNCHGHMADYTALSHHFCNLSCRWCFAPGFRAFQMFLFFISAGIYCPRIVLSL